MNVHCHLQTHSGVTLVYHFIKLQKRGAKKTVANNKKIKEKHRQIPDTLGARSSRTNQSSSSSSASVYMRGRLSCRICFPNSSLGSEIVILDLAIATGALTSAGYWVFSGDPVTNR